MRSDPRACVDQPFPPKPVAANLNADSATVQPLAPALRVFACVALFRDPPEHTRLRGLVSKPFTPHVGDRLRPCIAAPVHELLDAPERDGRMDRVRDFAVPLPRLVSAELLGLPTGE